MMGGVSGRRTRRGHGHRPHGQAGEEDEHDGEQPIYASLGPAPVFRDPQDLATGGEPVEPETKDVADTVLRPGRPRRVVSITRMDQWTVGASFAGVSAMGFAGDGPGGAFGAMSFGSIHVGGKFIMIRELDIHTTRRGLHEITASLNTCLRESGHRDGLCTVFVRHTSASLLVQENADPDAARDLEAWLDRLVPRNDPLYTHVQEGPDDMPSHIKSMLTATTLSIPFVSGALALGVWQGVFLWEHRDGARNRRLVLHIGA